MSRTTNHLSRSRRLPPPAGPTPATAPPRERRRRGWSFKWSRGPYSPLLRHRPGQTPRRAGPAARTPPPRPEHAPHTATLSMLAAPRYRPPRRVCGSRPPLVKIRTRLLPPPFAHPTLVPAPTPPRPGNLTTHRRPSHRPPPLHNSALLPRPPHSYRSQAQFVQNPHRGWITAAVSRLQRRRLRTPPPTRPHPPPRLLLTLRPQPSCNVAFRAVDRAQV